MSRTISPKNCAIISGVLEGNAASYSTVPQLTIPDKFSGKIPGFYRLASRIFDGKHRDLIIISGVQNTRLQLVRGIKTLTFESTEFNFHNKLLSNNLN